MARPSTHPAIGLPPLRMSYGEWQTWLGIDERNRGEWVDGEVVVFAMPKYLHQAIMFLLARLMADFVDHGDLGQVAPDGTEMWLSGRRTARLPDITFIAADHLDRLSDDRLDGPADLAVEVISNDSVTRDRRQKFTEYQEAGIQEYWIVDPRPRRRTLNVYVLDPAGQYQEQPPDGQGRLHSRILPGFWIDPAWLWQVPRPKPSHLIARIMTDAER